MHKVGTCIDLSDNSDKVKVRRLMIPILIDTK